MNQANEALRPAPRPRPALTLHLGARQPSEARCNHLLAALPAAVWQRWQPHLEAIDMPLGMVVCESGARLSHVVFPTTAIVSLQYPSQNGSAVETAVIGNDGLVGTWLHMGGDTTVSRAVVQSAGTGFCLDAALLLEEFNRGGPVMNLLLRYTQALLTQTSQTAVCNRQHSIEERLCHRLLVSLDRLASNRIITTQELMANILGVRRGGVTEAAGHLQKAGLVSYFRGHITVLNREGLEAHGCECYRVVKNEYDRLLPVQLAP